MLRETLSFDDVLLVPRYSTLRSRSDTTTVVNEYTLPIVMSPMDNITTPEMISLFVSKGLWATVHRYFKTPEEQLQHVPADCIEHVWFAVGSIKKSKDWIDFLSRAGVEKFIIDMAHGDCELSIETIKYIKAIDPDIKVMAGNVVTKSGFDSLQNAGADVIRVGIGGGCFTPDMLVCTMTGTIPISDIVNGDIVYTHTGNSREVINTIKYDVINRPMIEVNNEIKCTENHEFYVIDIHDVNIVNENNIHQYAKWIRADELSDKYLIVQLE